MKQGASSLPVGTWGKFLMSRMRAIPGPRVPEARRQALLRDLIRTPEIWKAGSLRSSSSCSGTVGDMCPSLSLSFPFCQRRRLDTVATRSFQLSRILSELPGARTEDADEAGGPGGGAAGTWILCVFGPQVELKEPQL